MLMQNVRPSEIRLKNYPTIKISTCKCADSFIIVTKKCSLQAARFTATCYNFLELVSMYYSTMTFV